MNARDREAALLDRCMAVARAAAPRVQDGREANAFRLAAMVLRSRFPHEAERLLRASDAYFAAHPGERLPPQQVVANGWVPGLPRLRDQLARRLADAARNAAHNRAADVGARVVARAH